jgi:hypothetical protein
MSDTPLAVSFTEEYMDADNLATIREEEDASTQVLFAQNKHTIFQYNHPHDSADYMHCAANNYIKHNYDTSIIFFAMSIGIQDFATVTEESPFSETKQKVHTSIFRPSGAILKEEVLRRAHFISKRAYKIPEDNPLWDVKYKKNLFAAAVCMEKRSTLHFPQQS